MTLSEANAREQRLCEELVKAVAHYDDCSCLLTDLSLKPPTLDPRHTPQAVISRDTAHSTVLLISRTLQTLRDDILAGAYTDSEPWWQPNTPPSRR